MNKPKVTMYTTPTCVYCKMTKDFFAKHDVEFQELNVAVDTAARETMVQKSGQLGVPVIDIDGSIVIGFDQQKLAELLHIK